MDIVWKKPWGYHCYHQQQYLQYRVVLGFIVQQRIPGTIQPVTWPGEIAINFHCSTVWLIFYDKIFMFQDFHDLKIKNPSVSYQNQTQNQTSETIWDHACHGQHKDDHFTNVPMTNGGLPFWIGDMSSLQLKMAWKSWPWWTEFGICIKSKMGLRAERSHWLCSKREKISTSDLQPAHFQELLQMTGWYLIILIGDDTLDIFGLAQNSLIVFDPKKTTPGCSLGFPKEAWSFWMPGHKLADGMGEQAISRVHEGRGWHTHPVSENPPYTPSLGKVGCECQMYLDQWTYVILEMVSPPCSSEKRAPTKSFALENKSWNLVV